MKAIFLLASLLSLSAMADSLHCKGMDSRLEIHGADMILEDEVSTVEVWSREHERANYADLFNGFGPRATVKELMAKKIIKASSMHGTFQLDLNKNTISVKNRGASFKDNVICEYRK